MKLAVVGSGISALACAHLLHEENDLRDATDLRSTRLQEIAPHYARTLRLWRQRFLAAGDRLTELGLPRRFQRLWEYYFSYCEAGFRERTIGDYQLLFAKPRHREEMFATVAMEDGS